MQGMLAFWPHRPRTAKRLLTAGVIRISMGYLAAIPQSDVDAADAVYAQVANDPGRATAEYTTAMLLGATLAESM
jgi:hypothetical protein